MSERSLNNKKGGQRLSNGGYKRILAVKSYPGFTTSARQPGIEYLNGFFCRYSNKVYENEEAKASEGGTTENERKYSIPGCRADI
jgi:hypothetical protein